jgi:hypothetical protein
LFKEELETVRAINVIYEQDTFAFDQSQLEDDICKKEFIDFGTPNLTAFKFKSATRQASG